MIFLDQGADPDPQPLQAGRDLDAVRVPKRFGVAALNVQVRGGDESSGVGVIIGDQRYWYFLVAPGSDDERWPAMVRYCGMVTFVAVPPVESEAVCLRGLRWIRAFGQTSGRRFTDASALRSLLEVLADDAAALRALTAPRARRRGAGLTVEPCQMPAVPALWPLSWRLPVAA